MTEQEYQKVKEIRTDMADVKNRIHLWEIRTMADMGLHRDEITEDEFRAFKHTATTNLQVLLNDLKSDFDHFKTSR